MSFLARADNPQRLSGAGKRITIGNRLISRAWHGKESTGVRRRGLSSYRRPSFESFELRLMMTGICTPTGSIVAELTQCRNFVTYSPSQPYNPNTSLEPTVTQIRTDLQQLFGEGFRGVVTYTLDGTLSQVPRIAKEVGFASVIAGIYWFDDAQLQRELAAINRVNYYTDAYVVGNEGLGINGANVRYTPAELIAQMDNVRERTGKPVATTEVIRNYLDNPSVIAAGDWLFLNSQQWFNADLHSTEVDPIVTTVVGESNALQALAGDRAVVIKEAWWPTSGHVNATEAKQVAFYQELAKQNVFFVWGEGYDQPWKQENSPNGVLGPSWGLHRSDRTPKQAIAALADIYQSPYFNSQNLLPGAIRFLQQMTLANGLPQNEATASELQTLSETNNSVASNNQFFNPAQAGFWMTTLLLSHAVRRTDATFSAGVTNTELKTELNATISSLESIANSSTGVYHAPSGVGPSGIAFYKHYSSTTGQPRVGTADKEVPAIDNAYLVASLLSLAAYLRQFAPELSASDGSAFLQIADRAHDLALRVNFAIWFNAATKRFSLGGTDNPLSGSPIDRIDSESRLVPVVALALKQISRADFDAVVQLLVSESRSGARTSTSPHVERLSAFGTALEGFVPTIFLATEAETLFGQSTLAQSVLAMLDTSTAVGLPAAGAMGISNGGVTNINSGANTYLNLGLSPTEFGESFPNLHDRKVLVPAAAALMVGATAHSANPHLQAVAVKAARNLDKVINQLQAAGQLDANYGAPNYLDFQSGLVNQANPVRGFLEIGQMATALLNDLLGGSYLEDLLKIDGGWQAALEAHRGALNLREMEFLPSGQGSAIIRQHASGGSNLSAPAAEDGGVWHLAAMGDSVAYTTAVAAAGQYRLKVRYSNDDTGVGDSLSLFLNGELVTSFATSDTGDWDQFTETNWVSLGPIYPGQVEISLKLSATDGFGVDLDTLALELFHSPWHNTLDPLDVTDDPNVGIDRQIVAGDALRIINYINAHPNDDAIPQGALPGPPYLDTADDQGRYFGDGFVVAGDALAVINWINAHSNNAITAQAEGEFFAGELGDGRGSESLAIFESEMPQSHDSVRDVSLTGDGLGDLMTLLAADAANEQLKRKRAVI